MTCWPWHVQDWSPYFYVLKEVIQGNVWCFGSYTVFELCLSNQQSVSCTNWKVLCSMERCLHSMFLSSPSLSTVILNIEYWDTIYSSCFTTCFGSSRFWLVYIHLREILDISPPYGPLRPGSRWLRHYATRSWDWFLLWLLSFTTHLILQPHYGPGLIHSLTEIHIRNHHGGKSGQRVRLKTSLHSMSWFSRKLWSLDVSLPYGPSRNVIHVALVYLY
jgi:hypothetical protein